MTSKANALFNNLAQLVKDNKNGKNICLISRGTWSDPQFAYEGYLLNYWDVVEIGTPEDAPEDYEMTDEEIYNACAESLFAWSESGQMPDKFTRCDAMSVTHVINIKL